MSNPLSIFEHEFTDGFNWTDDDATKICQLNNKLGDTILSPQFRFGKRELKATQYVGVVRFGNQTVQILPKIYRPIENQSNDQLTIVQDATENLLYLLAYTGNFPIRESEIASMAQQNSDWFEILTRLFAKNLISEWEKGAVRNYQTVEDSLPVLKGKWRFNEQMKRPAIKHMFSVAFDEFTADNKLNRVFRFVVERLFHRTREVRNRQMLGDIRFLMDEVTLLPFVGVNDASSSLLTRMNSRFTPLLNLARMFLDNGALRLSAGKTKSFAFVFDMNALFETFLVEFIRRHRGEILPVDLQDCKILSQTKGATRHLAYNEENNIFRLKPDIAFLNKEKSFPLLIDAKYKKLDKQDTKLGVSQSDFYQMHAYAHRYECQQILLIYPQTTEMGEKLRMNLRLQNSNIIIKVASVNLNLKLSQKIEQNKLIAELKEILTFTE